MIFNYLIGSTYSSSLVHGHFLCRSSMWYVLIIWLFFFVENLLCYFFQNQASKVYLAQGNLLKTTLKEKQSNLEKEIYGNISLYSQYFSRGAGSNDDDEDDELVLWYGWQAKGFWPFFQWQPRDPHHRKSPTCHEQDNSNIHKTYFYFLKLTKKYFILSS